MNPTWLHLIGIAVLISCAFVTCDLTDDPPQIEILPLEQTVTIGSKTVFVCTVKNISKLQIKWRKHGENIHYHPRNGSSRATYEYIPKFEKIDMTNGSVLKVNSAQPGAFECVVENGTEELVSATAQLKTIDRPPKIEVFPRDQTVNSWGIAVFVCTVTGSPNFQIKWERNDDSETQECSRPECSCGSPNKKFTRISKFETIDMINGSMLRLHAEGPETFDCVVEYGAERPVRATVHLKTVKAESTYGFPQIALRPESQRVSKGHRILLPCIVTGDPKPTIGWLKNKLPLNMSIPRYSLFEEQYLQISDTKEEDEGEYECIANNSVGTEMSGKIELLVSEQLQSPYFTIMKEKIYWLMPGSSLNITCLANGSPQPSVKWMKDSTVISPSRSGLNVLELTDIQGSHNYTCVASSEMGIAEATVQVTARNFTNVAPIAPTDLSASRATVTCIQLRWTYDIPEDYIHFFRVEYRATDDNNFHEKTVGIKMAVLCHLKRDTEYEFYVIAKNGAGEGPRSSSVFATTDNF